MKILLAIDGSEFSEAAISVVRSRPWPTGSIVRVFSAVPVALGPPTAAWAFGAAPPLPAGTNEQQVALTREAENWVRNVAESLKSSGLAVETSVRRGDPRSAIIDEAQEWGAELIVMGSRGHTGLKRWLLGSVAQFVVGHAPCSVEVVRPRQHAA